ncbi:hypothetical protein SAMN05421736_112154 [Evansella caseinilytica]|uniref:Uncharacterized protein n=1 Tax=Evansella caseinilytica TaxID=1503961 RepID=A0A1H3T0P3_9BACI|nr:hypothetical protein [Evansella caseinilytica]SDZ43401.1 hypothetical protein SAMN05421736_112154 [Evansella caseinilytica]
MKKLLSSFVAFGLVFSIAAVTLFAASEDIVEEELVASAQVGARLNKSTQEVIAGNWVYWTIYAVGGTPQYGYAINPGDGRGYLPTHTSSASSFNYPRYQYSTNPTSYRSYTVTARVSDQYSSGTVTATVLWYPN